MNWIKITVILTVAVVILFAMAAVVATCSAGSVEKRDGSGSSQPVATEQYDQPLATATAVLQPQ